MNAPPRVNAHALNEKCSGEASIFKIDDLYFIIMAYIQV